MCRAAKDGGQRCTAHARNRFKKLDRSNPAWDDAAVEYAATSEGNTVMEELWQQAAIKGDEDAKAHLSSVKRRGRERAQAHAAVRAAIKAAKGRALTPDETCNGPLSERLLDFKADFDPQSTAEKILPGHVRPNIKKVMLRAGQQPTPPVPSRFFTDQSQDEAPIDMDSYEYEDLSMERARSRQWQDAADLPGYGDTYGENLSTGPAVLTNRSPVETI